MQFYTVHSAAEVSGYHPQTVADAIRAGELHGTHKAKGKHWRVEDVCLRAWIKGESCEHQLAAAELEVAA